MGRQHGISVACAVAALAIVCAPGCGRHGGGGARTAPTPARAIAAAREACRRANIVIVCLDATRRDHVGCYGYARPTTPEIDRLAAQGVRFANAVSDATYTLAAVASLWSAQYPDTHGASVVGMRLPLALTTLPEACRAAGMRTAVITSSGIIIRAHGFGDGVDHFVRVFTARPDQGRVPDLQREWRRWLDAVGEQRFFLYVHIMPPHHPYEVAGQFRGKFDPGYTGALAPTPKILPQLDAGKLRISQRDRRHIIAMYDESLRYGDWALGTLVRDLRARGLLDNTLLIVFSDHGEAFGEHGRWLHASTVYDELTHIMLVARFPAGARPARPVVSGLAQLSDVMPTLASLADLQLPRAQVQGHDLAPEIFGGAAVRHAAFSRCLPEPDLRWAVEIPGAQGVFDDHGRLVELYDLKADPGERNNLARSGPLGLRLGALYSTWAQRQKHVGRPAARPRPEKLDRQTREWLRAIGYL